MKIIIYSLFLFLLTFSLSTTAQEDERSQKKNRDFHICAETGINVGGMIVNESLINKTAVTFQVVNSIKVSKRIYYGLGVGLEKYGKETFLPVFLDFKGLLSSKKHTRFLLAQFGYAVAWNTDFNSTDNYSYHGGVLFCTGLGHKFTVKEKHSVYIVISYKHQFVRFEYKTQDNKKYTEESGFDVIAFKIGLLL